MAKQFSEWAIRIPPSENRHPKTAIRKILDDLVDWGQERFHLWKILYYSNEFGGYLGSVY